MSKRPLNAFLLFFAKRRQALAQELPRLGSREITRMIAREWNALTPDERAPYVERAHESLVAFRTENPGYCYAKTKRRRISKSRRLVEPGPDPTGYLAWLGAQVIVQYLSQANGPASIPEKINNANGELFRSLFPKDDPDP